MQVVFSEQCRICLSNARIHAVLCVCETVAGNAINTHDSLLWQSMVEGCSWNGWVLCRHFGEECYPRWICRKLGTPTKAFFRDGPCLFGSSVVVPKSGPHTRTTWIDHQTEVVLLESCWFQRLTCLRRKLRMRQAHHKSEAEVLRQSPLNGFRPWRHSELYTS